LKFKPIKYPLSEEECLKIGGHCWEIDLSIIPTNPPTFIRICKHCGKRQIGRRQEPIIWSDIE